MSITDTTSNIANEIAPQISFISSTFLYTQNLLEPFANQFYDKSSIAQITSTVNILLPQKLAQKVIHHMNEVLRPHANDPEVPQVLKLARLTILSYIITVLVTYVNIFNAKHIQNIMLSYNPTSIRDSFSITGLSEAEPNKRRPNYGSSTILPWDVQEAIANSTSEVSLTALFQIYLDFSLDEPRKPLNTKFLPVTIYDGNTYNWSCEFVAGIILFSHISRYSGHIFSLTMFWNTLKDFDTNVFFYTDARASEYRYIRGEKNFFRLTTHDSKEYLFPSQEVLQGFAIGAQWKKIQADTYWKTLEYFNGSGEIDYNLHADDNNSPWIYVDFVNGSVAYYA